VIPLKDYNPTRRFPVVTVVLIAINVGVYFLVQQPGESRDGQAQFTFSHAAIPCEVVEGDPLSEDEVRRTLVQDDTESCTHDDITPPVFPDKNIYLALIYSMFLHGSLLHIGGNMLFLWIFGNNIEDRMGPPAYLAFYLVAGLVASAAHILVQPNSTIPVIGASGAVAGVMGAYLVLFPNVRIRTLFLFILILLRDIQAKWLLGFWFVLQFFTNPSAGVAWVAHVGGFAFGALVALFLRGRLQTTPTDPTPVY
jgi:membrane associated rhomboid family serine protease